MNDHRDATTDNYKKIIADYQSQPLAIGDFVEAKKSDTGFGGSSQNPDEIVTYRVEAIDGDDVTLSYKRDDRRGETDTKVCNKSVILQKQEYKIGYNPINPNVVDIRFLNTCLNSVLHYTNKSHKYTHNGKEVPQINWNPFVFNVDGEKTYYQRPLVWTLEEKQMLIESMYNNINIGTILLYDRGWDKTMALRDAGHEDTAFFDVVDGKQRLDTIIGFVECQYPDSRGYYFGDFSTLAMRKFLDFSSFGFAMMQEKSTDKDIIKAFLTVNFAGVPMSKEHVEFVKTINM